MINSASAAEPAVLPAQSTAGAAVAGSSAVRFVAVPGSGLEDVFPRPNNHNTVVGGAASPTNGRRKTFISAAVGTESASSSGNTRVADGDCGGVRARTASASTQVPEHMSSDWVSARSRRANTAVSGRSKRSRSRPPGSASAATVTRAKPLPPAWEPDVLIDAEESSAAEEAENRARSWTSEDERALRGRIRDTMARIEYISEGLQDSGGNSEVGEVGKAGGHGDGRGGGTGAGSVPAGGGRRRKGNQAGAAANQAEGEGSIKSLHESLQISLELVATGEKHASANTTTIADMSEWLSNLEQKQLVNVRQQEAIDGDTMAGAILAEGLAVGDCIREYSDQTASAFKRLATIFKTASAETERATKELVDRLTGIAEVGGGPGSEKEEGGSDMAPSAESVIKAKQVARIKHLQEQQLQEAAKTNEEAQAVINELRLSLQQLENRSKQVESMNTIVTANRHKDTMKWNALALEYEMKISYLERALAQEESKLRIAEQVHREEGLELHLEMVTKQRGNVRAGTKTAAMQEDLAALGSKLSAVNARLVIAENTKTKLEQELAAEKENYRKVKEHRSGQGRDASEEHEAERRAQAELHDAKMADVVKEHEQELASSRRQLNGLREVKDEEAGRLELEMKNLKADLEIAQKKLEARAGGDEKSMSAQAKITELLDEQEKMRAEVEYEKATAEEVLQDTVSKFTEKLKVATQQKKLDDERIAELEAEVQRLSARCKDLVQQGELTGEERARIEKALREQHRIADEQRVQETAAQLAGLENEQSTLLSRVLEAEAEADRRRRAMEDLLVVLDQAKSAQTALQAAAATQRADDSLRASEPKPLGEDTAVEKAARAKTDKLERELYEANVKVEDLELELTKVEQRVKDAKGAKDTAREEAQLGSRAEQRARAVTEAALLNAEKGPTQHEESMFQAQAILKAAVCGLEKKLQIAEEEVSRHCNRLADAEQDLEEMVEEVQSLAESRANMRVELHEAHCQIQRMTVERASLRRQGVESANLLTMTETVLRDVTGCIERKEHGQTLSTVVETLSALRQRNMDERAIKMNRARDRIEAENRARVEKALNALRIGSRGADVAGRLERAPAHLRPILAIFMSPAFKKAFLEFARQVACGEIIMPSASALAQQPATANSAAEPSTPSPGKGIPANNAAEVGTAAARMSGGTTAVGGGNPPPRRAISLDYPKAVAETAAEASAPKLARGAERRRQVTFGDAPPTKSEANLIAAGKHRSYAVKAPAGRNVGIGGGSGGGGTAGDKQQSGMGESRGQGIKRLASRMSTTVKWRKHRKGSDFNMTLTADTAVGRAGERPSHGEGSGGAEPAPVPGLTGAMAAEAAAEAAEAAAKAITARARQLEAQRADLERRESDLQVKIRLEEDAQRELAKKSDAVEAEAANIAQPGPEKNRLEGQLQTAISELEAGAARLDELCRLSKVAAAAKQETEKAYASVGVEEAEATKVAKKAAAAAAAASTDDAGETTHQPTPGDTPGATPAAETSEADTTSDAQSSPPAASAERSTQGTEEAPVGGVLDSKRPATNSVTPDSKRRRRSHSGSRATAISSQQDRDGGDGGSIVDSLSGAADGGGGGTAGGSARTVTGSFEQLVPHPVFARRERAAREAETLAASAADVVAMTRAVNVLAENVHACKGKLAVTAGNGTTTKSLEVTESSEAAEQKTLEELGALVEREADATKKLTAAPLESMLAGMELLRKMDAENNGDYDPKDVEANEAAKKELQRNISLADMVEVSVVLAESLLVEKEGTALRKRYQQQQRQLGGDHEGKDKTRLPSATAAAAGAAGAEAGEAADSDAERVHRCWNDEKAAENQRRVDILSESLEASDIHDLQVLRRFLQRQVDDVSRGLKGRLGRSRKGRSPEEVRDAALDDEETWQADLLAQRLGVVDRAVERKGGWRAAVFLDDKDGSSQVNVDVDVEPWPAADAVLMLQTVKDALNVELLESRSRLEELEDVAALVAGGGGLEDHLEVAADLHRAVALLWDGVGDALNSLPEANRCSDNADGDTRPESSEVPLSGGLQDAPQGQAEPLSDASITSETSVANVKGRNAAASTDITTAGEHAVVISGMLRDQELLDIPMHLEDSPLPIVTNALSVDAGRVQAAANFLVSGMLGALSAAAVAKATEAAKAAAGTAGTAEPAAAGGPKPAASLHRQRAADEKSTTMPPADCIPTAVAPTLPTPAAPPSRASMPQALSDEDIGSPPESVRQGSSTTGSDGLPSDGSEGGRAKTASTASSNGEPSSDEKLRESDEEDQVSASTAPSLTSETSLAEEVPSNPQSAASDEQGRQGFAGEGEGITQGEVGEAWARARAMEETARGLREVVEERGGVIGLLQREVEDLKAALASVETRPSETRPSVPVDQETPVIDPRLEQELEKAMAALGEERGFLADTTKKLDTSLEERERLLVEVAEAKEKEAQLETMLDEVCERERQLVAQMTELQQLKAADGAALRQLDIQIEEDPGLDEPAREELRVRRRQKAKKLADADGRLAMTRLQHENMWERAMKSYKWVHHLPQISVKNRQYGSIKEWIEAEIADQRKERKRLERAAHLRLKKLKPSLTQSRHRDHPSSSPGGLGPVLVTSLSGKLGPSSHSKSAAGGQGGPGGGPFGYGVSDRGSALAPFENRGSQRNLNVSTLLKGKPRSIAVGGDSTELPQYARGGGALPSALNVQAAQGMHASGFSGSPSRGLSSQPGGPASSSSPALTISIPAPVVEKGPASRPTPTKGGSTNDGSSGRTAAFVPRMNNQALPGEPQRYKSLFTNAPAELPGVIVTPAGGGGGGGGVGTDDEGGSPAGSAAAQYRPTTTWASAEKGGAGMNQSTNQPTNRRRAETAKIDYHSSVRRRSSNTSFTHPVGHSSGLDGLVQSQSHSRPDSLEGWGDGQAGEAASSRGSSRAKAKAGTKVSVVVAAATGEEPFRWIPGAQSGRTPVVHARRNNKGALSPGRSSAGNGPSGSLRSARSVDEVATTNRLAQPRRTPAATNSSRSRVGASAGSNMGWVGAVLDEPLSSPSYISPAASSSFSGLPRQLAVPGSYFAEEEATGIGSARGGVATAHNRLQHAQRGGGGGGRQHQQAVAGGGKGGRGAEANNLHPAWRPKGLTQRQRAVSIVERG